MTSDNSVTAECHVCGEEKPLDGSRYCSGCQEALVTDGGQNVASSDPSEVITICKTCGYARYWTTDNFGGFHGDDLARDHYEEMDEERDETHTVTSIVPSDELDLKQYPLLREILTEFEPGEDIIPFVDREHLYDEVITVLNGDTDD